MTIIQLEYLVAVAKFGSFSIAAKHCHVTQPSLSIQIKNLEDELSVTLLNRNVKPLKLTEAGEVILPKAKKAIAEFYEVEEVIRQHRGDVAGTLRLAIIPTIAPYLLHKFAISFCKRYPEVVLDVKEMFTRDIITALAEGAIDMAILAGGFTDGYPIIEENIFADKFMLYVSEKHPLWNEEVVSVIDVNSNELILLSDGHCLRNQILDFCSSSNRNYQPKFKFEGGSLDTIMKLVDESGGLTIIPEMAIPELTERQQMNIRPFKEQKSASRFISIATSDTFIKKSMKEALLNEIRKSRVKIISLENIDKL